MLQEFMRHFGSPLIVALPEVKELDNKSSKKGNFPRWKKKDSSTLWEVNKELPYGMFFTPNGNYDDVIQKDEPIKGNLVSEKHGREPYYHCLYAEIDRANKDKPTRFKTNGELWNHIQDVIASYSIVPSYVVATPGGFHLYWIFNDEEKEAIQETIGKKVIDISVFITDLFEGGDSGSFRLNKLFRVPTTFHRKTANPLPTSLYQYIDGDLSEEHNPDKLNYVTLQYLLVASDYIKKKKEEESVTSEIQKTINTADFVQINKIPLKDILERLKHYPRTYKGKTYTFMLGGNGGQINIVHNGSIETTNGYKYNQRENYVNCFSSSFHDIDERPRGNIATFLYYYFLRDYKQVDIFLKKEFNISIVQSGQVIEGEQILYEIPKDEYTIIGTNKRVQIKRVVEKANGKQSISTKTLFNIPVEIIGKTEMSYSDGFTESEHMSTIILCKVSGKNLLLKRCPTKQKFNSSVKDLFFYGEDNELGLFFEAIELSDRIKSIDTVTHSSVYDKFVYLGGNTIYGECNKYEYPMYEFSPFRGEEIPLREYMKKLSGLYEEFIAVPALLQSVALAGMNLWEGQVIYPALLLTGMTTSGKSTLGNMLKGMMGYGRDARKYALPSLSAQPLKQHASDYSVLFLEEITSDVQEKCEDLLRNIINRDKGARGFSNTNMYYNYRSPLMVMGERTFKDESINNRFLTVVMDSTYQKGNRDSVDNMMKYSCVDDIYERYQNTKHLLKGTYNEYTKYLYKKDISNRYSDVWAYAFVINDLFEIGVPVEELLSHAKRNLKNVGFSDRAVNISPDHQLKSILVEAIMKKQLIGTILEKDLTTTYQITMMPEFYQKHKAVLNLLCNKFAELGSDMCIESGTLTATVDKIRAGKTDFVLDVMFSFLTKVGRYAFTYT